KVLFVNDIDKDGSGTPDYMDGWGCTTTQIPLLEREKTIGSNHRYHNPENKFVPMGVSVEGLPTSIDTANVRIKFDYPESPPETMQLVTDNWDVEQFERSKSGNTIHLTRTVPRVRVVSNTGKIRIWKTDGNAQRNVATDYVRSSQTLMTYNDLQGINGKLFLEAINACTNWSGMRIVVSLSLDGGSTWAMSNAVRVTSMRCNFTAGVVRPFTFNGNDRVPFEPDYSTPLAAFTKAVSAFQGVQKHNDANGGGDRWWHDEDGSLGHGFAYFQYEGPDLGDTLTVRCSSLLGRRHDRRWYFGKTGDAGLTHWDYGAGNVNTQEQLAWWDICEHEIGEGGDLKKLVVKQTYTLKPERASALFDIFNDIGPAGRYANFGLHINTDPDVKGWGCLSNVGLAMATNKLDVANITRCAVSVNMPTTVNKSVWEVIEGARLTSYSQGGVPGSLTRAVWLETFGVAWDGDKETLGANALQGNLFNVLNGQPLAKRHPTSLSGFPTSEVTITNIGDITLDNARDNLRFYDPGLFPGVFGEQPKNVFNMEVGQ
ncbi:MAG: hypothetical protein FWG50_12170, partial [Kiritimatiellaeota bacterium]|nr:hypothetical protein [Kiritimatiellota bacterium]